MTRSGCRTGTGLAVPGPRRCSAPCSRRYERTGFRTGTTSHLPSSGGSSRGPGDLRRGSPVRAPAAWQRGERFDQLRRLLRCLDHGGVTYPLQAEDLHVVEPAVAVGGFDRPKTVVGSPDHTYRDAEGGDPLPQRRPALEEAVLAVVGLFEGAPGHPPAVSHEFRRHGEAWGEHDAQPAGECTLSRHSTQGGAEHGDERNPRYRVELLEAVLERRIQQDE